jgi:hypothetical protein
MIDLSIPKHKFITISDVCEGLYLFLADSYNVSSIFVLSIWQVPFDRRPRQDFSRAMMYMWYVVGMVVGSSTRRREHDKLVQCQLDHASITIVWKRHRHIAYRPKGGSWGFLKRLLHNCGVIDAGVEKDEEVGNASCRWRRLVDRWGEAIARWGALACDWPPTIHALATS